MSVQAIKEALRELRQRGESIPAEEAEVEALVSRAEVELAAIERAAKVVDEKAAIVGYSERDADDVVAVCDLMERIAKEAP